MVTSRIDIFPVEYLSNSRVIIRARLGSGSMTFLPSPPLTLRYPSGKVLMAKNYIDNLSEETRKGMLEKADASI